MIESSKQFPETDLDAAMRICQAHASAMVEKEKKRLHDLAMYQAGAGSTLNETVNFAAMMDMMTYRRYFKRED